MKNPALLLCLSFSSLLLTSLAPAVEVQVSLKESVNAGTQFFGVVKQTAATSVGGVVALRTIEGINVMPGASLTATETGTTIRVSDPSRQLLLFDNLVPNSAEIDATLVHDSGNQGYVPHLGFNQVLGSTGGDEGWLAEIYLWGDAVANGSCPSPTYYTSGGDTGRVDNYSDSTEVTEYDSPLVVSLQVPPNSIDTDTTNCILTQALKYDNSGGLVVTTVVDNAVRIRCSWNSTTESIDCQQPDLYVF